MAIAPHSSLSPLASGSGAGSHSGAKPKSDWSNTYFPPPPNRLEELEVSREACLGRKIEGAAIAEELVLSWLRHQAQDTLPSQINLAELNRATRVLYRLTAIQKTLMNLHAEISDWREKKNSTPPDNTPDDPELARELADDSEDSDNDPPSPPLGPQTSPSANVNSNQFPSAFTESAAPLGPRTSPSANATAHQSPSASPENATPLGARTPSSATPPASSSPQAPSPDAPAPASDTEPLSFDNSHSSPTSHASHPSHSSHIPQSDTPHSAFPIPHSSPRCASVHACPTIPHLNEDYFDQTLAMVTRLTGKPVHVLASSTCDSEPPAAQSPSPSQSPAQSDFADQSVGSVQSVQSVQSALPQSENPNPQSNNPQSDAPSVNPVNPVPPVHDVHLTHAHPVRTTLPHGPPRNQF